MSMAIKYAMNKKMAKGGMAECLPCKDGSCDVHTAPDKAASVSGGYDKGGMVDRIMLKMSKGGQVANDTMDNRADTKEAQFDDLVLRDDLESDYTGANSGDELGNAAMDENDRDLISRIMRSRAKKDRLPRPA